MATHSSIPAWRIPGTWEPGGLSSVRSHSWTFLKQCSSSSSKLLLEKAEEPEIKLPTSTGSLKKQESSRKNIYLCFIDYAKAFDCGSHKLWKILKEMGIPDHLTCLLRHLYTEQEATVRTGTPWKKGYDQTRQHIKKQRHYLADQNPSSQNYGFSHSHVRM